MKSGGCVGVGLISCGLGIQMAFWFVFWSHGLPEWGLLGRMVNKRHDTTLVVQPRPCIDKHGKEVPNGTIEDGRICTDTNTWHEEPQSSAHGKVREVETAVSVTGDCNAVVAGSGNKVSVNCDPGAPNSIQIINARPAIQIALAEEIAREEGWYAGRNHTVSYRPCGPSEISTGGSEKCFDVDFVPANLPQRLHNPGALIFAGREGSTYYPVMDGYEPITGRMRWIKYAKFPTDESGWAALHVSIAERWKQHEAQTPGIRDDQNVEWIAHDWNGGTEQQGQQFAANVIARLKKRGVLK